MDQVKVYLAILQKHHFWVVSSVVLVLSLVSWFMASSTLEAEFTANKAMIDSKIQAVNRVAGEENHPNPDVTAKLTDHKNLHSNEVFVAWTYRYEQQLKVPQWPRKVFGDEFVDFIEKRDVDAEIDVPFRELYQNYIKEEIETLFTSVNLREQVEIPDPAAAAAGAGAAAGIMEWKGLVAWNEADRESIRLRYDWPQVPTTLQVRYANEDLWVYRALLAIINRTNLDSDGNPIKEHVLANIKRIEALAIGQNVQPAMEFFVPPTPTGEGQQPTEGPAAVDPQGGQGEGAAAVKVSEQINNALKHNRYVDKKGKPLGFNDPQPFAEFKMMPFQINLVMDQRKIPLLLTNCANSPLPVEVRQVGVTGDQSQAMAGRVPGRGGEGALANRGGPMGRVPGEMRPGAVGLPPGPRGAYGGEGMRPPARQPAGGGGGGAADGTGELELRPFDLNVELRGVIYIFNKPDRSKVGAAVPAVLAEGATAPETAAGDPAGANAPKPAVPATAPPAATTPAATTPAPAAPAAATPAAETPPAATPPAATPPAPPPAASP